MPPGSTEWFVGECSTDKERQFVQAIRARAEHWTALDVSPNQTFTQRASGRLILAVDIDDPERNCILRTLRVDYDDSGIIFGPDETHQFATDLDIARPDVARCCITAAPEYFAGVAADWFEHELRRPIERHEWINSQFQHRRCFLADTNTRLCWSDSCNDPRPELGPPDRVVVVRDFRKI